MRATLLMIVMALFVAACGDGAPPGTTEPAPTTLPTTTEPPMTITAPAETTTTTTTTTVGELPGEEFDLGPAAGDELGVVGVEADDELNVRAAPGTDQEVLGRLAPTATGLVATGRNRSLPESIWFEVQTPDATGWVSSQFVGYLGSVDDVTAALVDEIGERPGAETMLDLGELVARHVAGDEEGVTFVMSVRPEVGDLGEVTYDVVGMPDDSVLGFRLHVFGDPGDESFTLRSVEQTTLCRRGVTDEGLCI